MSESCSGGREGADVGTKTEQQTATDTAREIAFPEEVTRSLLEAGRAVFDGDVIAMGHQQRAQLRELRSQFEELDFQTPDNDLSEHFFDARRSRVGHMEIPGEMSGEPDGAADFVRALVEATVRALPGTDAAKRFSVSWMLARHASNVGAMPVHRDEVDWVAEFNVSRTSGAFGGAIQILDDDDEVVAEKVLERPMDGYIIDDARYRHGVTPMTMGSDREHRDVLIVRIRAA
jgi:hypothetical protein